MPASAVKNMVSGSIWGVSGKLIDAMVKFAVIPLMIAHYGRKEFALVSLVISLNAYMRMMDLGMNVGGVRYFAIWLAQGKKEELLRVARASFLVYGGIGIVNAIVFILLAIFGKELFRMDVNQHYEFQWMLVLLAMSTVFSWLSYVVDQLLNANEEFIWISKMAIVSSLLNIFVTAAAIWFNLSIVVYFFLYLCSILFVIPFNVGRLTRLSIPLGTLLRPKWHPAFREVFKYSLALFAMGVFQASADAIRPILLGAFAVEGIEVLADYRVIQAISMLVVSMGGLFLNMLVPVSAKMVATNDKVQQDLLTNRGTIFITAFLSILIGGLILNGSYILGIFVGPSYAGLQGWLSVWLLTLLLNMHMFPVTGVIMSTGKTKPLVLSSAIGCIVSVLLTILLAHRFGIGAAILGYLGFVLINLAFTYGFYIPVILQMNAKSLFFNSFLRVVGLEMLAFGIAVGVGAIFPFSSPHLVMFAKSVTFVLCSFAIIWYAVINSRERAFLRHQVLFSGTFRR